MRSGKAGMCLSVKGFAFAFASEIRLGPTGLPLLVVGFMMLRPFTFLAHPFHHLFLCKCHASHRKDISFCRMSRRRDPDSSRDFHIMFILPRFSR